MRIVTLLENTSCRAELSCEHGLSLYIEDADSRILFDAGQTELFAQNARTLGVDLRHVDLAVLSHGHYDHSGGMAAFLELNPHAPVYVSPFAFEPHFNAAGKDIGVSAQLKNCGRLRLTKHPTPVGETGMLYPSSCLQRPFPVEHGGMETLRLGQRIKEDFRHEQYLLMNSGGKRILFSGCSHIGICNIVCHFRPDILIGGFHLSKQTDPAQLERIGQQLFMTNTVYYTGHCTGTVQYAVLKEILGERLNSIQTGTELTVSENGDIICSQTIRKEFFL